LYISGKVLRDSIYQALQDKIEKDKREEEIRADKIRQLKADYHFKKQNIVFDPTEISGAGRYICIYVYFFLYVCIYVQMYLITYMYPYNVYVCISMFEIQNIVFDPTEISGAGRYICIYVCPYMYIGAKCTDTCIHKYISIY
jgi:hypothetical protein